jgi:hypothetical protein
MTAAIGRACLLVAIVLLAMGTDSRSSARPGALGFASALTIKAITGELAWSLGVVGEGMDRVSAGVVTATGFVTTTIAPSALEWSLGSFR